MLSVIKMRIYTRTQCKAENVEPTFANPTDVSKCPPEFLPDLRTEDPAVEPCISEQGKEGGRYA